MTHLALDKNTGDLILKDGGGVERTEEARFVTQQVQCKLRTGLAEWLTDQTIGWIELADFEKHFDQFSLESRARKIILETKGVSTITALKSEYHQRKMTLYFTAETIYGTINLTIPWSNV